MSNAAKEREEKGSLMRIDAQILSIDKVICRHLDNISSSPRGVISQDVLSQLRNFVEL